MYRKYRPRKFSEAIGQEPITRTLAQAINSGKISHAYLFTGPRGVGKTSIARILAHEINQLPYQSDDIHLDIIEIDAASNRRIDEIRNLRDKVNITPTSAKYKVYIIDEVHMLTKEAFNALLKTLEEPPAHCVFILATTEAHKLPETIVSRTQRFNFKPISKSETRLQLQKIAKDEKISIDKEALEFLADFSDGSLRDIIGMLDQLSASSRKITLDDVRELLGVPSQSTIDELTKIIIKSDISKALGILALLQEQGTEPAIVAKSVGKSFRQGLVDGTISGEWVSKLLKGLVEVTSSQQPQDVLEITILEAATRLQISSESTDTHRDAPSLKMGRIKKRDSQEKPIKESNGTNNSFKLEDWDEITARLKAKVPSLNNALRLANVEIAGNKLELTFPYKLHQKKIMETRNLSILNSLIKEVSGDGMEIVCHFDKNLSKEATLDTNPEAFNEINASDIGGEELQSISNIFGSAEVLES